MLSKLIEKKIASEIRAYSDDNIAKKYIQKSLFVIRALIAHLIFSILMLGVSLWSILNGDDTQHLLPLAIITVVNIVIASIGIVSHYDRIVRLKLHRITSEN